MDEFFAQVIAQTDLAREAENYRTFRANFEGFKDIVFPRLHDSLCGPRIITMDFVRGVKVNEVPVRSREAVAGLVRKAFFKMCFVDGFLHVDLHPGNMLVTPGGALAIFDAGLVKQFDDQFYRQFVDFTRCLTVGQPDDFVDHLRAFHGYLGEVDWESLSRDLHAIMERFKTQSAAELEGAELTTAIFALCRRYGIRPVINMTVVLVGWLTCEGISKNLDPHHNPLEDVAAYILPVMARLRVSETAVSTACGERPTRPSPTIASGLRDVVPPD